MNEHQELHAREKRMDLTRDTLAERREKASGPVDLEALKEQANNFGGVAVLSTELLALIAELEQARTERDQWKAHAERLSVALNELTTHTTNITRGDCLQEECSRGCFPVIQANEALASTPAADLEAVKAEAGRERAIIAEIKTLVEHFDGRAFHVGGPAEHAFMEARDTCATRADEIAREGK